MYLPGSDERMTFTRTLKPEEQYLCINYCYITQSAIFDFLK